MKVSKIQTMQIIRRVSQIIAFIFFAGVFTLTFSGIQQIYTAVINRNFALSRIQMFIIPVTLILVLSVLFGRIFCGWFCAFGALNDFLYMISGRLFKNKLRNNKFIDKIDSKLKYLKYILLVLIIAFVWTLKVVPDSKLTYYSPWTAFAQFTSIFQNGSTMIIAYILLFIIAIGALFIERFFCRYLCPLGAFMGIISKIKIFRIAKPTKKCSKCRLCSFSCPMGIDMSASEQINSAECISCLRCVSVCPKKNAHVSIFVKSFNSVVYAVSAIIIFFISNIFGEPFLSEAGIGQNQTASVSSTALNSGTSSNSKSTTAVKTKNAKYKDGTYTGVGQGFRPDLNVSVTIKNGLIKNIKVVSSNDTPGFIDQAVQAVPSEIIQSQSADVDTVSGATFSSRGIIEAVKNALAKAE